MCKKLGKMFSLLPLVSASHFVLAYSIQCFTIFLIYCTNLEKFIDFKSIKHNPVQADGEVPSDEDNKAYNENPLHYFPTFFKHHKDKNENTFQVDEYLINFETLGFVIGSLYAGMLFHGILLKIMQDRVLNDVAKKQEEKENALSDSGINPAAGVDLDKFSESSSSDCRVHLRPQYEDPEEDKEDESTSEGNLVSLTTKIIVCGIIMTLWMLEIASVQSQAKWEWNKWVAFCLLISASFIGGLCINLYSRLSIDVINLSSSKKPKFKIVAIFTFIGQVFGPFLIAYLLLFKAIFGNSKSQHVKYFMIFVPAILIIYITLIKIGMKLSAKQEAWKLQNLDKSKLSEYLKQETTNRKKGCFKTEFAQFFEKFSLFIAYGSLSLNQTFLTLSLLGQNFKVDDGKKYEYRQIFALQEIVYLTALPFLFCALTSFMVNKILYRIQAKSTNDDISRQNSVGNISKVFIIFGLIMLSWSFIFQTQQNPEGVLYFIGDTKSDALTFQLMVLSLVFLGISQSLIVLGSHAYLVVGTSVKSGDIEDYPFTVNSIYMLNRIKQSGSLAGALGGSTFLCTYMKFATYSKIDDINILGISYRLQDIFQYYTLYIIIPWTVIYIIRQIVSQCTKGKKSIKEDADDFNQIAEVINPSINA